MTCEFFGQYRVKAAPHRGVRIMKRQITVIDARRIVMLYSSQMRITVNLPDDVYRMARSLAATRRISLSEALADLVRQHCGAAHARFNSTKAFPCFVVPDHAQPITLEQTLAAEDEM